jgi:hypothetical protein
MCLRSTSTNSRISSSTCKVKTELTLKSKELRAYLISPKKTDLMIPEVLVLMVMVAMVAEEDTAKVKVMVKVQVTVVNPVDMVKDLGAMVRALVAMATAPTEEMADPEEAEEMMPILYS